MGWTKWSTMCGTKGMNGRVLKKTLGEFAFPFNAPTMQW
jgi:hypothetical protein